MTHGISTVDMAAVSNTEKQGQAGIEDNFAISPQGASFFFLYRKMFIKINKIQYVKTKRNLVKTFPINHVYFCRRKCTCKH